jgi:hypothetical protein
MSAIGILVAVGLAVIAGRFLLRRLGLPADAAKAIVWGAILVLCGLTFATLRDCRGRESTQVIDAVGTAEILLLLLVVALALIGRSWVKARLVGRERDRRARQMRRRALPPAPNFPQDGEPPGE